MTPLGTLLKEIWAGDSKWVLRYCASTDDYVMELTRDDESYAFIRGSTVDEVVRKTWSVYYGAKK